MLERIEENPEKLNQIRKRKKEEDFQLEYDGKKAKKREKERKKKYTKLIRRVKTGAKKRRKKRKTFYFFNRARLSTSLLLFILKTMY